VALSVFAVLYGWLPWLIDGHRLHQMSAQNQQTALTDDRGDVLKAIAGMAAVVAIIYTVRRHSLERKSVQLTQETLQATRERDSESSLLTRDAQVTDRYTKAIAQLASSNPTECLGGIYALERIMNDSERDHETIVEVLAAFVREHAAPPEPTSEPDFQYSRISVSLQAALTVIGRRPERHETNPVDLNGVWLPGVVLPEARMHDVNFYGANLSDSNFVNANLERAYLAEVTVKGANLTEARLKDASLYRAHAEKTRFAEAHLEGVNCLEGTFSGANFSGAWAQDANFFRARMEGANFYGARLEGSNFRAARLGNANFRGAHLDNVNFSEVDLTEVRRFTAKQLSAAWMDESTVLPPGIQLLNVGNRISETRASQSVPENGRQD
jgi:uncharacterized protein YjbI with pentapeptide repeats